MAGQLTTGLFLAPSSAGAHAPHVQVTTIPTLAVIDATTGAIVTTAGRDAVDADPTGARFPWTPPSLLSLAQGPVATASGRQSDFDSVARGKVTGLYFSAHWCPPCRRFTPQLVDFYNSKKGTPEEFEVVFVSRCDTCRARTVYVQSACAIRMCNPRV